MIGVLIMLQQSTSSLAQTNNVPDGISSSTMQALFLYNFAKFIEWPEKVFTNNEAGIRLCLYGEKPNDIRRSVDRIDGKTAQGRKFIIRHNATLPELLDCQIIFIPGNEQRWLPEILRIARTSHALSVSDMDDFIEVGGAIGLLSIDQQIRFEVNLEATDAARLRVSAKLLRLARTVKGLGAKN